VDQKADMDDKEKLKFLTLSVLEFRPWVVQSLASRYRGSRLRKEDYRNYDNRIEGVPVEIRTEHLRYTDQRSYSLSNLAQQYRICKLWNKRCPNGDHLEPNTCRTTRDFSLQFKHIQAESSESRYQ
jgi:hypothetical protein